MSFTIAFAGKGGTGKTTLAALTVRALAEDGAGQVLAVDADPNATLHEALGVEVERTVGELTEDLLAAETKASGMPKEMWLEYNVQRFLTEEKGFDLLSMGRPEGAGCYCYANNLVRGCIDKLQSGYDFVVMDNEAGLEHLSRRTTRDVDLLLLISDPTIRGMRTAARVSALADELKISVGARYVVVNRVEGPLDRVLADEASASGLAIAGVVPPDPAVTAADLACSGLFQLSAHSPALAAMRGILHDTVGDTRSRASVGS